MLYHSLTLLESAANSVGLYMNCNETEYMLVKDCEHEVVKSLNENILKQVDNFKCLGSYISSSKKDFEIRKAQAFTPYGLLASQPKQK